MGKQRVYRLLYLANGQIGGNIRGPPEREKPVTKAKPGLDIPIGAWECTGSGAICPAKEPHMDHTKAYALQRLRAEMPERDQINLEAFERIKGIAVLQRRQRSFDGGWDTVIELCDTRIKAMVPTMEEL